jgi:hypothetical protein
MIIEPDTQKQEGQPMKEQTYLVRYELEGEICDYQMKSYGLGSAVDKAKRIFDNPLWVVPIRKNLVGSPDKYTIEKLEERKRNGTI